MQTHNAAALDCFINSNSPNVNMTYFEFTVQYDFANSDDDAYPVLVYTNESNELVAWFDIENDWGYVA